MKSSILIFLLMVTVRFLSSVTPLSADPYVTFPDLKNWEKSDKTREFFPENLFDYINGAADSYLSYQFRHLWVKEYIKASGASIKAEIYEHQDENDAFGIYSIERAPEYNFQKLGGQAYRYEDILNMTCGKYYVKLHGYDLEEADFTDLDVLAQAIADHLDPEARLPEILEKFPSEDRVPNSGMYIAENFLGYEFLKNAFASIYRKGDHTFQLFVIQGEDETSCRNMLESYLKFARQDPSLASKGLMVIPDRYNGDIYVLWKDDLILGTVECTDETVCVGYLNKFESNLINNR
jgi:hypothetical protein